MDVLLLSVCRHAVPDRETRNFLAYARPLIRESGRHGGSAWIDYDRVFRQHATLDHTLQWNMLHPGIQAATLIGRGGGVGAATLVERGVGAASFCTLCREPDHPADQCALTYLRQPTIQATVPSAVWKPRFHALTPADPSIEGGASSQIPALTSTCARHVVAKIMEPGTAQTRSTSPLGRNSGQQNADGRNPGRNQSSRP